MLNDTEAQLQGGQSDCRSWFAAKSCMKAGAWAMSRQREMASSCMHGVHPAQGQVCMELSFERYIHVVRHSQGQLCKALLCEWYLHGVHPAQDGVGYGAAVTKLMVQRDCGVEMASLLKQHMDLTCKQM